ncbi:MAG: CHAT domain-containing protein [Flavisolibacter sp.]
MRFTYLFFLLLCGCLYYSISQSGEANISQLKQQYAEADAVYKKALKIGSLSKPDEKEEERLNHIALNKFNLFIRHLQPGSSFADSLNFFALLKTGELSHYFDDLHAALHSYQSAIAAKAQLKDLPDSFLFKPYLFSGNIYYRNNDFDSALFCFRKAEAILESYSLHLSDGERLFNVLGVLYYQSGNYRQAKNYFRKAAELLPRSHPYYRDLFVNYNINFASVLVKLQLYDSAFAIYKKLLPFEEHAPEIHNNIGLIYYYSGKPVDAIREFRNISYGDRLDVGLHNDMARSWLALNQLDSVRAHLDMAFEKNRQYNKEQPSMDHGLSLKLYGDLIKKHSDLMKAIYYYQQALHQFYPSFSDTSIQNNPAKFSGVFSYINLFETLVSKAEALHALYQQNNDKEFLKMELKAYLSAFHLINYIERTYDSDEARLFLGTIKYHVHEKPIDAAYLLFELTKRKEYLEQAYEFDQVNKGSVLSFNEQQNQLSKPSLEIRQKEKSLKEAITRLALQAAKTTDAATINRMNDEVSEFEIQLGKLQDEISKTYPIAGVPVPTISSLQTDLLDDHTQLLSFHLAANKVTIFSVTKKEFNCRQIPLPTDFYAELNRYILQLHSNELNEDMDSAAHAFYQLLLAATIDQTKKRLIIIADDELNLLPFESLKQNDRYLVQDYSVQYQYSTLLLRKTGISLSGATTVSFAPFAKEGYSVADMHFETLSHSLEEVSALKGKSFIGKLANKESFLRNIPRYDIIHLATHASSGDSARQLAYIVFAPWGKSKQEDYLLYAPEIYSLSVKNNKLVILSACETGKGSLVRGEGVMSLSRAFAYAGCPNVITSFWKADDVSTSFITEQLHRYLSRGYPIDEALQRSKNDYLDRKDINPRMKTPAYWAHLVYIGDYAPQNKNDTGLVILVIGIVILIASSLALVTSRNRKRARRIRI